MKNVQQLQSARDSLSHKYVERKHRFISTMIIYNYFKRQPKPRTAKDSAETNWLDSTYALVDYRTMIKNIKTEEKNALFKLAQSYATNAQSFIKSNVEALFHRKKLIYKHDIEWHKKFTLSFACLILFFIGAPFGAIIRKGGLGLPMVVSVLLFLTYYVISMIGEKSAAEMATEPAIGMWLSSAILLPLGIFLSYKASRDSNLFSSESYYMILRWTGRKIKRLRGKKKA
jgi:lipopolysaccharide export system permease protein